MVARHDQNRLDRSYGAIRDAAPHVLIVGQKAAPESNEDRHPAARRLGGHRPRPVDVVIDRFLAVRRFAGAQRLTQKLHVSVGGGRDHHGVEVIGCPCLGGGCRCAASMLVRYPLRRRLIDIHHPGQLGPGVPGDIACMDGARSAHAKQQESHHRLTGPPSRSSYIPHTVILRPSPTGSVRRKIFSSHRLPRVRSNTTRCPACAAHRSIYPAVCSKPSRTVRSKLLCSTLHSTTNRSSAYGAVAPRRGQMMSRSVRPRPRPYSRSMRPPPFTMRCRKACNRSWGPASG